MEIKDTVKNELKKIQDSIDSGLTSVPISKFDEFRLNRKFTSVCYKVPELHTQFLEIQKKVKEIKSGERNSSGGYNTADKDPTKDLIDEMNG